jgi:hypothetical protein
MEEGSPPFQALSVVPSVLLFSRSSSVHFTNAELGFP